MRPWRHLVAALALVAVACTAESAPPRTFPPTTATTSTTQASTTSTTTTAPAPTSSIRYAAIRVRIQDDPEAEEAVAALYSWIADPSLPEPDVPEALLAHVAMVEPEEDVILDGELHFREVPGGRVGVVIVDEDVTLLADEGDGWTVVGAHLKRFDLDPWFGEPVRHVLVLGTDARPGQSQRLFRADSIHILSSNVARTSGTVLGFPRDTLVQTSYGQDKFTHVNAVSERNTDEMVDIARQITGLPVEGYIVTGFLGFQRLVDDFGGVVIDVPFAISDDKAKAYLSAGVQRLWGANALAFSRVRQIAGGDFTRSFHQGLVILGALHGVLEEDITALPDLVAILLAHTWTDLSVSEMLTVAAGAFVIDPVSVANLVLPGESTLVGGAAVVLLDDAASEAIFRDLDDGVLDDR